MVCASNAAINITAVGDGDGYEISGDEVAAFRSTGTAKSFDADDDNAYGTAGYLVFGGAATSEGGHELFGDATAYSHPSFVTTFATGNDFLSISKYLTYPLYDDPSEPISETVADFGATAVAVANANTGAGAWNEMLTFTIDATAPSSFRVGLMAGSESNTDGRWDPSGLRISFEGGTAVEATGLSIIAETGLVFFDISVTEGTTGTFSIESQRRATTGGSSISGVTFDTNAESFVNSSSDFYFEGILAGYDFDADATDMSAASEVASHLSASQLTSPMDISFVATTGDSSGVDAQGVTFGDTSTLGCIGVGVDDAITASFDDAVSGVDYVTFTVTPDDGFRLSLATISFKATKKASTSVDEYAVTDASGNMIGSATLITNVVGLTGTYDGVVVDLSGADYDPIREATEFRIYAWGRGSTSTSGSLAALDKITLSGVCSTDNLPLITNGSGVSNLFVNAATLTGTLMSTGAAPTRVWACWGESDGGTNLSAWAESTDLGILDPAAFSVQATNLTTDLEYVYRCAASNEYGMTWSGAETFTPSYPILTVDPVQLDEGDSGSSVAVFTVRLSCAYPEAISFTFTTTEGLAGSADYDAENGTRTFLAGETEMEISITVWGDELEEDDEEFYLSIVSAEGAVIEDDSARCVIFSDDREYYLSPTELVADADGQLLYVAESTAGRIGVIDLVDNIRLGSITLPQDPTGMALSADRATLYVTAGVSTGEVYVVDTDSWQVTETISVGHSPREPVLTNDNRLYVCERFLNTVAEVDLASGSVTNRIEVLREPHGAALTPDGATLVVGNLLPHQPSTQTGVAASISLIDTVSGTVTTNICLPPGSHSLRDVAISPDGNYAVVAHTLGRYRVTPSQFLRGWSNTSALSIIDLSSKTLYNAVDIDDLDEGAANPWGMSFSDDGETLCIAHAGTHEISAIDWEDLLTKLADETDYVCDDLTYLAGLRRRLPLPGNGPRGIAIVGTKAYAAEYFSDSLSVVDLTEGEEYSAETIELGWEKAQTDVRLGNQYFLDGTLSVQQWQSCSSCHPDVRVDGLNWDELNDGFGNPKNVKSLLMAHYTAPTTVTGVRPNAETSVLAGLLYSHYRKVLNSENLMIDAFLMAEQPVPSPYLVDGELSEAALRGQVIFDSKCIGCHSGTYLTDQELHDVGTDTDIEAGPFDTPSLIEAWRTAPYLHDGRAQTINDVLEAFSHGSASGLTDDEIDDLVEYVNSL
jgi:cytochrome c peroxidase/sugar lactone lactonase YvrE